MQLLRVMADPRNLYKSSQNQEVWFNIKANYFHLDLFISNGINFVYKSLKNVMNDKF